MAASHIPPPEPGLAPNNAPGREFWLDPYRDAPGEEDEPCAAPIVRAIIDPALPNLSQQQLVAQIYTQLVNLGTAQATALSLATARAALMCSG